MITIDDFNVKTGTGKSQYPESIGKYGKGRLNTNGRCLLEYAKEHDMYLPTPCSTIRYVIEPLAPPLRE